MLLREEELLLDFETRVDEEVAPLLDRQRAVVRRVAQLFGFLLVVGAEEHVLDHDDAIRDTHHLAEGATEVVEVVSCNSRDDDVERAVCEWNVFGGRHHVGAHPGRRIERHDLGTLFAQTTRDMTATGGDVEHLHARVRVAELDERVQVVAGRVRDRGAVQLGPFVPGVRHRESSTAFLAASSMVGST